MLGTCHFPELRVSGFVSRERHLPRGNLGVMSETFAWLEGTVRRGVGRRGGAWVGAVVGVTPDARAPPARSRAPDPPPAAPSRVFILHGCLAHAAPRAVAELPERLISRDATPACPLTREVSAGRSDSMRLLRRLSKPKSQHARQFLDSATARRTTWERQPCRRDGCRQGSRATEACWNTGAPRAERWAVPPLMAGLGLMPNGPGACCGLSGELRRGGRVPAVSEGRRWGRRGIWR